MYPEENCKESDFLKKLFGEYYSKNTISVPAFEKREFGYGVFKRKIANRNVAFTSEAELNSFLRNNKPLFLSHSIAYYAFPDRKPMENKHLLGADLIYEFDADELGLEVEEIDGKQWFKKEHLDKAREEIFKLINFLEKDFGFSSSDFEINFSGKAGYHLHIRSEKIRSLNKQSRIELVDYLTGAGIHFESLGYDFQKGVASTSNALRVKRLNFAAKKILTLSSKELAILTGIEKKKIDFLLQKREEVIGGIDRGVLFRLEGKKSAEFWEKIFQKALDNEKSPIDRQTSVDLHKIVRVASTLHGDTGFLAKKLTLDSLKTFDPFSDAIVFTSGTQRVFIKKAPKFTLNEKEFGPYENEEVELPLYAAVYLIGKGAELR